MSSEKVKEEDLVINQIKSSILKKDINKANKIVNDWIFDTSNGGWLNLRSAFNGKRNKINKKINLPIFSLLAFILVGIAFIFIFHIGSEYNRPSYSLTIDKIQTSQDFYKNHTLGETGNNDREGNDLFYIATLSGYSMNHIPVSSSEDDKNAVAYVGLTKSQYSFIKKNNLKKLNVRYFAGNSSERYENYPSESFEKLNATKNFSKNLKIYQHRENIKNLIIFISLLIVVIFIMGIIINCENIINLKKFRFKFYQEEKDISIIGNFNKEKERLFNLFKKETRYTPIVPLLRNLILVVLFLILTGYFLFIHSFFIVFFGAISIVYLVVYTFIYYDNNYEFNKESSEVLKLVINNLYTLIDSIEEDTSVAKLKVNGQYSEVDALSNNITNEQTTTDQEKERRNKIFEDIQWTENDIALFEKNYDNLYKNFRFLKNYYVPKQTVVDIKSILKFIYSNPKEINSYFFLFKTIENLVEILNANFGINQEYEDIKDDYYTNQIKTFLKTDKKIKALYDNLQEDVNKATKIMADYQIKTVQTKIDLELSRHKFSKE